MTVFAYIDICTYKSGTKAYYEGVVRRFWGLKSVRPCPFPFRCPGNVYFDPVSGTPSGNSPVRVLWGLPAKLSENSDSIFIFNFFCGLPMYVFSFFVVSFLTYLLYSDFIVKNVGYEIRCVVHLKPCLFVPYIRRTCDFFHTFHFLRPLFGLYFSKIYSVTCIARWK